ncbi:LLM class flavin-dependent oxidoreductase [Kibdelosporangium phytohabitans]|uniref:LLM class flavin-dependent oxidoreductase n=1 Tax=Kibdelosporangium phytohabitans TaxID=860235 RepID=UPI0019DF1CD5|nr:LLM class flavin-dependent oxidoreductase [Kibdelosporangium phytohabitans]MBE1461780.1 alkanesulfonate monooxygenase SsuD/methylene tetrahydromethanopterin reductase-like flavin-dependent oxidoreductase (luciferase family) [Kibdelosporangium phytohabitans]
MDLVFGANIKPTHADPTQALRLARRIDRAGLDLVTIQDHPYRPEYHDTWTLLTFLAAGTTRVAFVPTVANLPLRPPAMLAKSAASLDSLTGGRVRLGLGAGAFWDDIVSMGGPRRTPGEAVDAVSDAIDLVRSLWTSPRFGPAPSRKLEIWLGANGPRMLDLVGTKADGWQPSLLHMGLDKLPAASARIDTAATLAGRPPGSIRKVYNLAGRIGSPSALPLHGSRGSGPSGSWNSSASAA